jgi:hypothetical protein
MKLSLCSFFQSYDPKSGHYYVQYLPPNMSQVQPQVQNTAPQQVAPQQHPPQIHSGGAGNLVSHSHSPTLDMSGARVSIPAQSQSQSQPQHVVPTTYYPHYPYQVYMAGPQRSPQQMHAQVLNSPVPGRGNPIAQVPSMPPRPMQSAMTTPLMSGAGPGGEKSWQAKKPGM